MSLYSRRAGAEDWTKLQSSSVPVRAALALTSRLGLHPAHGLCMPGDAIPAVASAVLLAVAAVNAHVSIVADSTRARTR